MEAKFPIGTRFYSTGKHKQVCTIIDVYRTYNQAGECVKLRYVATHNLLGQPIADYDVVETTIARNLIKE